MVKTLAIKECAVQIGVFLPSPLFSTSGLLAVYRPAPGFSAFIFPQEMTGRTTIHLAAIPARYPCGDTNLVLLVVFSLKTESGIF